MDTEQAIQQTIEARDATATQQAFEQATAVPPTATATMPPTDTPVPPTATNTAVPPTNTPTATLPPPTNTATAVPPTLIPPTPVPATSLLDLSLTPNYGSATLIGGFLPDPYTVDMFSGGNVDVSYLNRNNCTGFATAAPDFRLYWESSGTALNFMFIPDFSGNDTTLIINNPAGDWYCSDDFDGLNPGIRFNSALSGQYDIWIGSFSATDSISGHLNITELDIPPIVETPIVSSGQLDHSLPPNYGSTTLSAGFLPDPYTVSMISGGAVDASYLSGYGCTGYATAAPDFRLFWEGNSDELNFMFTPDFSGNDTTLIINDPVGNWYCSDDFDGLNPGIRFDSALSGQYDIWIGSYSPEENIAGKLLVSELDIP